MALFWAFVCWRNLPSSLSEKQPASLLENRNLSLESKKTFFSLYSFYLHLWVHFAAGKRGLLMGPSPQRGSAVLHSCLSLSLLCFSLGGFVMKRSTRAGTNGSKQNDVEGLEHNTRFLNSTPPFRHTHKHSSSYRDLYKDIYRHSLTLTIPAESPKTNLNFKSRLEPSNLLLLHTCEDWPTCPPFFKYATF